MEDPLDPGPCLLADGEDAGELAGRRDQLDDVGGEGQERAQGDFVVQGEPAAEGQDGHLPDGRDGLEERLVTGLQADGAHLGAVDHLRGVGHPLELALLLAEGLDHAHTVDVLVDDLHHFALALLTVPCGREDPAAHAVRHDEQRGGDDQADHRELRRQVEHDRQREQHEQHVAAHDGEEAEQSLHQRRVGVGPGHQLAGRHAVEVVEVEYLEVLVHGVAQIELHAERHATAPVTADVEEPERGE